MPTQPPLPHLLAPYVSSLPPSSLTVLSSVLGATGNWLVLRYLYAALGTTSNPEAAFGLQGGEGAKKRKVVLVSFLRGWDFWRSEAKRLVSIPPKVIVAIVSGSFLLASCFTVYHCALEFLFLYL